MAGFMIEDLESGKVQQFHWNDVEDLPCNGSATLLDVRTAWEYQRGIWTAFGTFHWTICGSIWTS